MTVQFLTDKHNLLKQTAPAKNVDSLIHPQDELAISAAIYASGTGIIQPGRLPGLWMNIPEYSAEMRPSGSTSATGHTHHFYVAMVGTPHEKLMAYPAETVSAYLQSSAWIPTN